MNRKLLGSVLALLLAAIGTFILVAYVRAAEDRALAGQRVVDVLVVAEEVPKGTLAEELGDRVSIERVPEKVAAQGVVTDLADLEGRAAVVDLVPGEQVLDSRFQSPEDVARSGEVEVPEGLQEVTVSLTAERAAGGRIEPGDTVGVISSFDPFDVSGGRPDGEGGGEEKGKTPNTTHIILHKVLVTDVRGTIVPVENAEDAPTGAAPGEELLVTLAVDANAVEKIVFTEEFGFLWLSAEPEGAAEEPTQTETRGTIYE